MTSEDDTSLSEDEIDEIVGRVVDRLQEAGVGNDESAEDDANDGGEDADTADAEEDEDDPEDAPGEEIPVDTGDPKERAKRAKDRAKREKERTKERAKREARRRKERHRHGRSDPDAPEPPNPPGPGDAHWDEEDWEDYGREWEAFGERMEDFGEQMERFGERLGRSIERKLERIDWDDVDRRAERAAVSGLAGLNVTPDEHTRTAIYKSQLQKGGRIAVPDAEIEALGIEPGDTLQVVLFPIRPGDQEDDETEPRGE